MKRVRFAVLPGVGTGERKVDGTIADLLDSIPYLLAFRVLPPAGVLNEVLRTGESDAGMSGGCRWEPFALAESDWETLAAFLANRDDDEQVRFVEPPAWVNSLMEWQCWVMEYCHGIPAEGCLRFKREVDRLETDMRAAEESGDTNRATELLVKISKLSTEHSDFMAKHRKPHVWNRES